MDVTISQKIRKKAQKTEMSIFSVKFSIDYTLNANHTLSPHEPALIYSIASGSGLERNFGEVARVPTISKRKAGTDGHGTKRGQGGSGRKGRKPKESEEGEKTGGWDGER